MWCSRTGPWPRPSPARDAPGSSSNSRSDDMTEPAQAIRLDIPRPAPEIVKGFQALATTGVAGFIVDGVIRDIGESRANGFPLFARGRSPIPAAKEGPGEINHPIRCGGVVVHPGDIVVADDEGIVVVPLAKATGVLKKAQAKAEADAQMSLEAWEKNHRARVDATLKAKGYLG